MLSVICRSGVAAASLLVLGCEGGDPQDSGETTADEPLELELGAGRTEFVELPEDAALEIVSGPQGGWHLELTLQLRDYDRQPLVLDYQARDMNDQPLGFPASYAVKVEQLVELDDARFVRVGDRVVLDVASPEQLRGLEVQVTCSASRDGQELASTQRTLRLVDEVDELR